MIRLITFSDSRMTQSKQVLCDSALHFGIDSIRGYGPEDLPPWLYHAHPYMNEQTKGFGWYAWKPWIVFNEIMQMNEGDLLIYADAGQTLIGDPRKIFDACSQDIILFSNGWTHAEWCKGDAAKTILGKNWISYYNWNHVQNQQTQASLLFLRVTETSRKFIQEWFAWSLMPGLIDNSPSITPNYPTFAEHRWDQAILGCLAIKHRIKLEWFPTTMNMHQQNDIVKYPAIVDHHRKRNHGKGEGDSEW